MASIAPSTSVWHRGEIEMQRTVGADATLAAVGARVVRDHLIEQHRDFFSSLPMVVLATIDSQGDVWPTVRAGRPGFLEARDERRLRVALADDLDDPATEGLVDGAAIAMLGIDPGTRRRNRLNGTIVDKRDDGFDIEVGQSFGNCPKYIRLRDVAFAPAPAPAPTSARVVRAGALDESDRHLVEHADTFFVATYADRSDGRRQADVSHRGGRRGFVRVGDDGALTIPDFAGNRFFNTLGNIRVNPRAGLVFVDFDRGNLLQLAGRAEVLLDSPETARFEGAERLWRFVPQRVVRRTGALPLLWTARDGGESPFLSTTGTWTTRHDGG